MKKQIFRVLCVIISVLVVAMSMPVGVFAAEEVYCESFEIYVDSLGEKLYCEYYNLYAGDQLWLGCTPYPEDAVFNGELIYSGTDSDIAEVSVDGLVIAKAAGSITVTAQCGDISDQITINVTEKEKIIFGETYNSVLNENNLGEYVGTFMAPAGGQDYKITYSATAEITVQILNEYGDYIIGKSGTDGIIRCGLSDSFAHQVVVISNNIKEEISFDFTVEPYTPVQSLEITDQEGNDFSDYNAEVGETFSLGCNIYPVGAETALKWVSSDPEIAQIDEQGNVTVLNAGYTNIAVYAVDDDGVVLENIADHLEIYSEKTTDSYFGNSHYIILGDVAENLEVVAPHSGYFYIMATGDDENISIMVTKSSDGSIIETDNIFLSDTQYRSSMFLQDGVQYKIIIGGANGSSYNIDLGQYDVPESIYITDTNGNVSNEYSCYISDGIALNYKYDKENCYQEICEWRSSDESIATVDVGGYVNFLEEGTVTITVTNKTGLSASTVVTGIEAKEIALDTPINETLSVNGVNKVRFKFEPTVSSIYRINVANISGGETFLNFEISDSSNNGTTIIENSSKYAIFKLEAGNTYFITVYEQGMGGSYVFTLKDNTISVNTSLELFMPEGYDQYIDYYFIPEKTGFYLFKTSGYVDDGYGRGVVVVAENGEKIADFGLDGDSSRTYASLNAGEIYRICIVKYYWNSASFTFELSESVGITSMSILSMPTNSTILEGSDNYSLNGLSLEVTTSDGDTHIWNYDASSSDICGFPVFFSVGEELDGIKYVYIIAGGAECAIPFTVKALQQLALNTPVEVSYGMSFNEQAYRFTPQKTGWYLFKGYDYQIESNDRYICVLHGFEEIAQAGGEFGSTEVYVYLTAGEAYTVRMHKNYQQSDNFMLSVTESIVIESITIKQYPSNMNIAVGFGDNPDLSGLVLTVVTSDGQTRDWAYTEGADNIFGYKLNINPMYYEDFIEYRLSAAGKSLMLTYTIIPYPLESIEAITAGEIIIIENTNGWFNDDYFYYNVPIDKIRIKIKYNDGSYKFAVMDEQIDGYFVSYNENQSQNHWTVDGENYFTVTFADKTINVPVKIVRNTVVSMEVIDDGNLSVVDGMGTYEPMGEDTSIWTYWIDYSKVKIKLTFADGTYVTASPGEVVKGADLGYYESQYINPIVAGKQNFITVTYGDLSVDLPVSVRDNGIESITLTKKPTKPYIYGDKAHGELMGDEYRFWFSLEDGYEFTVKYDDGTERVYTAADFEDADFYNAPVTALYNPIATKGVNRAYIAWGGVVMEFDIELIDSDVVSIEVLKLPEVPEGLKYFPDMTGLTIKITYVGGTEKIVTLTKDNTRYEGSNSLTCIVVLDDANLTIRDYYGGNYKIDYKGVFAEFNIGTQETSSPYDMELVEFDSDNETITVGYLYTQNSTDKYATTQVDLSLLKKTEISDNNIKGFVYSGVIETEKGLLGCRFSYYLNSNNGLVEYSIKMLNNYINGLLLDTAGDVTGDGKVDVRDLVRLKKLAANSETAIASPADFDGDGRNSATDITYLRKCIFGEARLSVIYGDADGNGYVSYNDSLVIAMYLAGSKEILSSRADIDNNGVIDQTDLDLINSML